MSCCDLSKVIEFKGESSTERNILYRVPQRSALFLMYINDLAISLPCTDICKFADDATFINTEVNSESSLNAAAEWFSANKQSMNENET